MNSPNLNWQSKLVLLLVVAPVAVSIVLETRFWSATAPHVLQWTLGLSALLGLLAWLSRSATPAAALTGALLCACLMFSTSLFPYHPWQTAIVPVLTVLVLTSLATRFGRRQKEKLGLSEEKRGRNAAQVCANLGFAALICCPGIQSAFDHWLGSDLFLALTMAALAALAEAAADTASSEIGQVLGGRPFLLTTMRRVAPGTDGAISPAGTLAGILASCVVAASGALSLQWKWNAAVVVAAGGVFGLLFDSLLGATIERKGWLNNDAVNFLSTASAAIFALAVQCGLLAWAAAHGTVI